MSDETLNILMTDPHSRGGGQVTYLTRLATELTRLGHRVTLGCRPGSVLVDSAREAGCAAEDSFHFARGLRLGPWSRDLRGMHRYLRETPPDILHASGSQDHWAAAFANRRLGRPVCLVRTRHNTYPVKNSLANRILNRRWTDYQIVVCESVRQSLAQQPPFDHDRMCSIHNGVDAQRYRPSAAIRGEMRALLGYGGSDLVCGIAARLAEAKGHVFFFKAVAQLVESYPQLRVAVLGQGVLEASLKALAERLGIASIVRFLGFREDMARCVQAFDLGVQPSIDCDTSSFSLKEQMAAEKPVIASDHGGLKEIVSDGVEGFIVAAGEVNPLAAALRRLLDSEALRQRMGVAGRRRVLRDFTLEVFAERTLRAYRRAIGIHRASGGRYT